MARAPVQAAGGQLADPGAQPPRQAREIGPVVRPAREMGADSREGAVDQVGEVQPEAGVPADETIGGLCIAPAAWPNRWYKAAVNGSAGSSPGA